VRRVSSDYKTTDVPADTSEKTAVSSPSIGLSDAGIGAMQGPADIDTSQAEEVDTSSPREFGKFAHQAYQSVAYETFDDVDSEVPVVVTRPDGTEAQGYVDTMIGKTLIDYKTNDMRNWDTAQAARYGNEHGQQMQAYVASPSTPQDATGWIVATVPSESEEVRQTYADTLASYGVGARFAKGEDQDSVMDAVRGAVESTETQATSNT
jgi:hypothetical protein